MKAIVLTLIAVLVLGFGSIALAGDTQAAGTQGPVMMTDAQMDDVVAAGNGDMDRLRDPILARDDCPDYVDGTANGPREH